MVIKKYNLTLRNFNYSIINIILKANEYHSIEEYEFGSNNRYFELFMDVSTNHITYIQPNINLNCAHEKYRCIYVEILK